VVGPHTLEVEGEDGMKNLTRITALLVLAGIVGVAVLIPGSAGSTPTEAQETPPPPHAIMVESEKLCVPLLIAFAGFDPAAAALSCVGLDTEDHLLTVAAVFSQRDGRDTPIFDPALTDDPDTVEQENRFDTACTSDFNGDGELCGPGDIGVDDTNELKGLIDLRDDDELDGQYTLRASDFAPMDLDANQLHELDGTMTIIVFNDGNDHPVRFRVPDDAGVLRNLDLAGTFTDIACGSALVPGVSFFDEDCDDDNVPGDGVKVVELVPGTPPPERGAYQFRITEPDRETYLDYAVVGEPDDLSFTPLKTVATSGTDEDDCSFDLSVAGVVEALGNPGLAIVLVHALDSDGTQVANTLLDWRIEPEELAFPFLPQTPTVDLGSFGKGFPQAICGDEGTGVADAVVSYSATLSIDPNKPPPDCRLTTPPNRPPCTNDPEEETIEITIVGPPAAVQSVVATPATVACDGTQSTELVVTVVDENGDLVANGHEVQFSIQVLGTASPITTSTTDGVAKSTITPLAARGTGAPVVISVGDVESSFLVQCAAGSPQQPGTTPPPPGTGTGQPGSGITGPDTGSGGQAAGRGELNAWPVVMLFVAAMGLAGARFGLRRVR
jgi:hypothetical protein